MATGPPETAALPLDCHFLSIAYSGSTPSLILLLLSLLTHTVREILQSKPKVVHQAIRHSHSHSGHQCTGQVRTAHHTALSEVYGPEKESVVCCLQASQVDTHTESESVIKQHDSTLRRPESQDELRQTDRQAGSFSSNAS